MTKTRDHNVIRNVYKLHKFSCSRGIHDADMDIIPTYSIHKRGRIKDDSHHHGVIECLRSTAQIQAYICNPYKDPKTTRFRTASLATYHASATISLSHVTNWFYVEEEKKRRDKRNKLILLPCCSLSMLLQTLTCMLCCNI